MSSVARDYLPQSTYRASTTAGILPQQQCDAHSYQVRQHIWCRKLGSSYTEIGSPNDAGDDGQICDEIPADERVDDKYGLLGDGYSKAITRGTTINLGWRSSTSSMMENF